MVLPLYIILYFIYTLFNISLCGEGDVEKDGRIYVTIIYI